VPANAGASNAAFEQKRGWLEKSLLAMNAYITQRASWSEEEIMRRSDVLGDVAVQVWPAPVEL
jgi:Protein of unknown function (DUF1524)